MKCPDQDQLLLYVEKELSPEAINEIESHLAACPFCSRAVEEVQHCLAFTDEKMKLVNDQWQDIQLRGQGRVWQNIQNQIRTNKTDKRRLSIMRFKKIAIAAAMVMALVMVGSVPAVQTAAANFLQVLRMQQVDTVNFTTDDMNNIEQALKQGNKSFNLDNFGKIETIGNHEQTNLDYDDLGNLGFQVKLPPSMEQAETAYYLEKMPVMQITPDVNKVNEFIQALGSTYLLPDSLDGQTFRFKMGDMLEITSKDTRLWQGPVPELEVPAGVEVSEVARAMIALPIWPEEIKRQLEAVNDWEHTLVLPGENSEKVKVNGQDAVLLSNNPSWQLIWQEDSILYILDKSSGNKNDLIETAQSLR